MLHASMRAQPKTFIRLQSKLSQRGFVLFMLKRVSKYKFDERIFDGPID